MKSERIETFTDGVVAIIITLMVLEMKLPELRPENATLIIRHIGVYALSFISIAIIWLNHHNMFSVIEKVDTKTIWTNLFLLFFMSLIPLPTKSLGEHFLERESYVFFGSVMTATSITYSVLQMLISKTLSDVSPENKIILQGADRAFVRPTATYADTIAGFMTLRNSAKAIINFGLGAEIKIRPAMVSAYVAVGRTKARSAPCRIILFL